MIVVEKIDDKVISCMYDPLNYKTICEVSDSSGLVEKRVFISSSKDDRYMKIKRLINFYRRKDEDY